MNAIWHDIECGPYAADLQLWEALAKQAGGPILELGCGTGRVALHLGRRGHEVVGLDVDADLVHAFNDRAGGMPARAVVGDARGFDLDKRFALVLAPMQLLQLLAHREERISCLKSVAAHLQPRRTAALAIVEDAWEGAGVVTGRSPSVPPIPDSGEMDGWVYSSLPLDTVLDGGEIVVRRLRQTVSPSGELGEEIDRVRLQELNATTLEQEAGAAGLLPTGRRRVAPTADHVGSTAVLLEARP